MYFGGILEQAHCIDSYPYGFLLTSVTQNFQKCFTWPHPLKCQRWGVAQGTDRSSQELFCHKSRTNPESLREGWKRRRRQDSKREGSRAPPEQLICYTSAVPTALKHLLHSPVPMTEAHIFTFWKTGLLLLTSSIFTTTWAVLVRGWGPPEALSSVAVTFRTYSVPWSSGNGLARSLTSPVKQQVVGFCCINPFPLFFSLVSVRTKHSGLPIHQ